MDDLIAGYRRFRAGTWRNERDLFEALSRVNQSCDYLVQSNRFPIISQTRSMDRGQVSVVFAQCIYGS